MRVLVAGNRGYLGSVVHEVLQDAGHDVTGIDIGFFDPAPVQSRLDVRDVSMSDVAGHDAVVNLAAICNDACGELSATATHEINATAATRLAKLARQSGVPRYILASSCSVYGAAHQTRLGEQSQVSPDTAYAASKVAAERALARLASRGFSPVSLRFATLFGVSPSFRSDILVNRLVGTAMRQGAIHINGDGRQWRPLLHVRDAAGAIARILNAPAALVSGQVYNVGTSEQNHRLIDVVRIVCDALPSVRVHHGPTTDRRSYAVRFDKFANACSGWAPRRSVRDGVRELIGAYHAGAVPDSDRWGVTDRRERLLDLRAADLLDHDFRWAPAAQPR